jgi:hypothetical protein
MMKPKAGQDMSKSGQMVVVVVSREKVEGKKVGM